MPKAEGGCTLNSAVFGLPQSSSSESIGDSNGLSPRRTRRSGRRAQLRPPRHRQPRRLAPVLADLDPAGSGLRRRRGRVDLLRHRPAIPQDAEHATRAACRALDSRRGRSLPHAGNRRHRLVRTAYLVGRARRHLQPVHGPRLPVQGRRPRRLARDRRDRSRHAAQRGRSAALGRRARSRTPTCSAHPTSRTWRP